MNDWKRNGIILGIISLVLLLNVSVSKAASTVEKAMPWIPILLMSNTTQVTLSGSITIPHYTPAGGLAFLVDGTDGYIYGAGTTDVNGNYSITFTVPEGIKQVRLTAVDPNAPDYFIDGIFYVDNKGSSDQTKTSNSIEYMQSALKNSGNNNLSIGLQAETLYRDFTGRDYLVPTNAERQIVNSIFTALGGESNQCRLCTPSTGKDLDDFLVTLAIANRDPGLHDKFTSYVQQPGTLQQRLEAALDYIESEIWSSNHARRTRGPGVAGIGGAITSFVALGSNPIGWGVFLGSAGVIGYGEFKVIRTRNHVHRFHFSTWNGLSQGETSFEKIEAAANIIMRLKWGNCQEKGLLGAYLGSLFPEFKQAAHVVINKHYSDAWVYDRADHSAAIACTEGSAVYDLKKLSSMPINPKTGRVWLTEEFINAGCYLIDLWDWKIVPITDENFAVNEDWVDIKHVMAVNKNSSQNNPSNLDTSNLLMTKSNLIPSKNNQICPADSACQICLNEKELEDNVCMVFLPPTKEPPATKKYYLLKRSGTGYRKFWGGYSTKYTGYDYSYWYATHEEVSAALPSFSDLTNKNVAPCANGPALCPCPPYPDIWQSGKIEVVGAFENYSEIEPYRCDNPHYGGSYLICNMWTEDSQPYPGHWPTINSMCGD